MSGSNSTRVGDAGGPLGTAERPLRVAVIGSGPSAFYAVEALFKAAELVVRCDVFDRLPTPYGLVRGGVAPDHQKIKSVVKVYEKTAADPRFRFFGNVRLGGDVQVDELRSRYDALIYAVGNESDRAMGIGGEDLTGSHSATSFVGWYNGHPDFSDREFGLEGAERVAVVGNGNVAMDVTRILVSPPDALAATDIAEHALDALRRSRVREVLLLGRRGPAQAAFSPKEIEEVGAVEGAELQVDAAAMELDPVSQQWLETAAPRAAQRNVRYLREASLRPPAGAPRRVRCQFLISPVEILGNEGRVSGIRLQHNELYAAEDGTPRPRATERFSTEEVQLVFRAIGYRGIPIEGVPFDARAGVIPNADGRVLDAPGGAVRPFEYVVGWAKRGPTGLIGTNSPDSKLTVQALLADVATTGDADPLPPDDAESVPALLHQRGVDYVSYDDWLRLDAYERERGEAAGKVRAKLTTVVDLMDAVRRLRG